MRRGWVPLVVISAVLVAVYLGWRRVAPRRSGSGAEPARWPPFGEVGAPATGHEPPPPDWVEPVDGACPAGYPVKVKETSGIFHVPGGRFYDRTVADRCYATAAAAESDGYRAAKA